MPIYFYKEVPPYGGGKVDKLSGYANIDGHRINLATDVDKIIFNWPKEGWSNQLVWEKKHPIINVSSSGMISEDGPTTYEAYIEFIFDPIANCDMTKLFVEGTVGTEYFSVTGKKSNDVVMWSGSEIAGMGNLPTRYDVSVYYDGVQVAQYNQGNLYPGSVIRDVDDRLVI